MAFHSQTSIANLPVELLDEIIDYCPNAAQVALCLVSRHIHSVAIKRLYKDIVWSDAAPAKVVACCKTFLARPAAASAVRTLLVDQLYVFPPFIGRMSFDPSHAGIITMTTMPC